MAAQVQDVMLVLTGEDWFAPSHEADIVYDNDLLPRVVRFGEYTLAVGLGEVIYIPHSLRSACTLPYWKTIHLARCHITWR